MSDVKKSPNEPDGSAADLPNEERVDQQAESLVEEWGSSSANQLANQAYSTAVRLLARRDHSVAEIVSKLRKRDVDPVAIDSAIQELLELNYLNDKRYAELYAEQRMAQGYGPLAINAKLRERGVDGHHIQYALSALTVDWSERVALLIHRRFSAEEILGGDQRIIARIARFLQGRGFSSSDAARGMKAARENVTSGGNFDG